MLPLLLFLLLLPTANSIGVIPAKIETSFPANQNSILTFYIYDSQGGYYTVTPTDNLTSVVVSDCNYWCWNKTYYVPPNTTYTNGTKVEVLVNGQPGYYEGKFVILPSTTESGMVSVIGGVATEVKLTFNPTTTSPYSVSTTAKGSSVQRSVTSTTTSSSTTLPSGVSHRATGQSTTGGSTTSTTLVVTTTTTPSVSLGITPAKVTLYSNTTITFIIYNPGNYEANITIEPDPVCSSIIKSELPDSLIIPANTTIFNGVKLPIYFEPKQNLTCGINFLVAPKGYGNIMLKQGVRVTITSNVTAKDLATNLYDKEKVAVLIFLGLTGAVTLIYFVLKYLFII